MKVSTIFMQRIVSEVSYDSSKVEGAKERLKQARAELAEYPSSPKTQKEFDAIDEAKEEIARLEKFIKDSGHKINENESSAAESHAEKMTELNYLIVALEDVIRKNNESFKKDPTNWGYVTELDSFIEALKDTL